MASARLNFVDHPDGSFSCQAVYLPAATVGSSYNPRSHAHQNCRILQIYIGEIRDEVPPDGTDEDAEASRPTLATEASMHFIDQGEVFRVHRQYLPRKTGFDPASPSHLACMLAQARLNRLNRAVSDALVTDAGGAARTVPKAQINAASGN